MLPAFVSLSVCLSRGFEGRIYGGTQGARAPGLPPIQGLPTNPPYPRTPIKPSQPTDKKEGYSEG